MRGELPSFIEFEHKYLIHPDEFAPLRQRLQALPLENTYTVAVTDRYFITQVPKGHVYRLRQDAYLNQLTVKSLAPDSEQRLEVNLNLKDSAADAEAAVRAFLSPLGLDSETVVEKEVEVFYLKDCEVTLYRAKASGLEALHCLELEVREFTDRQKALSVLTHYESLLGKSASQRCQKSLFDLLVLPSTRG